jgi:hypothetical protein
MPVVDLAAAAIENRSSRIQKWLITAGIVVVLMIGSFLVGLVPIWLREHRLQGEFDSVQHELKLNQWQNELGTAAIDARRGEYESARQSASKFFSEISDEMGKTSNPVFTPAQLEQLKSVLGPRDEIITLLARNDPVSADKLTAMHVAFRAVVAPAASK